MQRKTITRRNVRSCILTLHVSRRAIRQSSIQLKTLYIRGMDYLWIILTLVLSAFFYIFFISKLMQSEIPSEKKNLGELWKVSVDVFQYHIFVFINVESILKSVRLVSSPFFQLSIKSLRDRKIKYGCYDIFISYEAPVLRSLIEMNTLDLSYDAQDIFDELKRSVHHNREKLIILFESPDWKIPLGSLQNLYHIYGVNFVVGIIGNNPKMKGIEKCELIRRIVKINHSMVREDKIVKERMDQAKGILQLMRLRMRQTKEIGKTEEYERMIWFFRMNYLFFNNRTKPVVLSECLENPIILELIDQNYYEGMVKASREFYGSNKYRASDMIDFMRKNHTRIKNFSISE